MALPQPIKLRIILIVVVLLVLLIAFFGHYWSDWTRRNIYQDCSGVTDCPDIGMERFYLAMLFFSLFGTFVNVLLVHFNKNDNKWLKLGDFILHVVLGVLLLIGVITFFVSTLQVNDIFDEKNEEIREREREREHGLRVRREGKNYYDKYYQWIIKIFASIFGLAVVAFHGYLACMTGKLLFQDEFLKQGQGENAEEGAASQSAVQASPSKQGAEVKKQAEPEGLN